MKKICVLLGIAIGFIFVKLPIFRSLEALEAMKHGFTILAVLFVLAAFLTRFYRLRIANEKMDEKVKAIGLTALSAGMYFGLWLVVVSALIAKH